MKTASLIKKHNECARLLSDIEKESNPECLALLYELYANALIAIVRGPIEKVFNVERTGISDKPIRQINQISAEMFNSILTTAEIFGSIITA